jgi:hypothetical protein
MPNEKAPLMSDNMIKQTAQSKNLSLKPEVHLGVQFPGRGLVMECRAGTGLR